jgi:hypothetical protein
MLCYDKWKRDLGHYVSLGLSDARGSRQQQRGVKSISKQSHSILLFTPASPDGAVGLALNSMGSSRQVRRERLEQETWSPNPNSRHSNANGRVTYLHLDGALHSISVSGR